MDNDNYFVTDNPLACFYNCTWADNDIGGAATVTSARPISLCELIIDQPGIPSLSYSSDPDDLKVIYMLAADWGGLPGSPVTVEGEPDFVDAAHADYHLTPTSPGVDFAPARGGTDLDGHPRDVDVASVTPDFAGPRDLGACERQSGFACDDHAGAVFCNGFEVQS